jgi:hypothetical protein
LLKGGCEMSRPKKEKYIPRSISEGKSSPVCISVEKFLEMEDKLKHYETALDEIMETAKEEGSPQDWIYYDMAKEALENFTKSK